MSMTGGCLCGAIRFETKGDPVFGGHCYCSDCRKTSSSHTSVVAFPESAVKFLGEARTYTSTGGSGQPVTRGFCATCGTQMFSTGESNKGLILLRAGTLDEPAAFAPMAAIYASRAPHWDQPPAGLPAFPEMPPRG